MLRTTRNRLVRTARDADAHTAWLAQTALNRRKYDLQREINEAQSDTGHYTHYDVTNVSVAHMEFIRDFAVSQRAVRDNCSDGTHSDGDPPRSDVHSD